MEPYYFDLLKHYLVKDIINIIQEYLTNENFMHRKPYYWKLLEPLGETVIDEFDKYFEEIFIEPYAWNEDEIDYSEGYIGPKFDKQSIVSGIRFLRTIKRVSCCYVFCHDCDRSTKYIHSEEESDKFHDLLYGRYTGNLVPYVYNSTMFCWEGKNDYDVYLDKHKRCGKCSQQRTTVNGQSNSIYQLDVCLFVSVYLRIGDNELHDKQIFTFFNTLNDETIKEHCSFG
jgi:hypothetical protein